MAGTKLSSGYLSSSLETSGREIYREECRKMMCLNKIIGERWGSHQGITDKKDSDQDYLWGGKRVFWGQKEPVSALKKGRQTYDLSVQKTSCDRRKQKKQENIFCNGSLGGPEISSVEEHGWYLYQAWARAGCFKHTVLREENGSPELMTVWVEIIEP